MLNSRDLSEQQKELSQSIEDVKMYMSGMAVISKDGQKRKVFIAKEEAEAKIICFISELAEKYIYLQASEHAYQKVAHDVSEKIGFNYTDLYLKYFNETAGTLETQP